MSSELDTDADFGLDLGEDLADLLNEIGADEDEHNHSTIVVVTLLSMLHAPTLVADLIQNLHGTPLWQSSLAQKRCSRVLQGLLKRHSLHHGCSFASRKIH